MVVVLDQEESQNWMFDGATTTFVSEMEMSDWSSDVCSSDLSSTYILESGKME